MTSPAQRHFSKVSAEIDAKAASKQGTMINTNQYELMLMQLAEHKRTLKEVQSFERKAEVKKQFLPLYDAYVDGVIQSDAGVQDEVLMTIMVWRVDAGDLWGALTIGEYALAHDLKTPEQYNRTTATLLAEEVAEFALRQDHIDDFSLLLSTEEITLSHDMPDEVRAKLHKAIGLALSDKDIDEAIKHLNRALHLNSKAGVKKLIEKLEREKKKAEDN